MQNGHEREKAKGQQRSRWLALMEQNKMEGLREGKRMDWKKALIYGSFAAGAFLFITGRRPVGLAIAGIGVATLAAENPEKVEQLWRRMPEYIEKGGKFLDMAATFLEKVSQQQGGGYRNIPVAGSRY
jgi:hypothetical protein